MNNNKIPVVAIFDVGKTNKKLFLFDSNYQIVFERSPRFLETKDEDGDPCENLESLRLSVFDSLHEVFRKNEFEIKAINFTSYGASFVYLDENGRPLTPLYNYLKEFPATIQQELHNKYGGEEHFSLTTSSPTLGSLNSGFQILRLKKEHPEIYKHVNFALHLPQYLSFLVSGKFYSDMTSIGCHTALWDFENGEYHKWVQDEGITKVLAPIVKGDEVFDGAFPGSPFRVGPGLHDSSSALIPYLFNFSEPFVLISTGTWCITFNPFNNSALTSGELKKDCLFYQSYLGNPVKASRLFAGYEHELQSKRIADFFHVTTAKFRNLQLNLRILEKLMKEPVIVDLKAFSKVELDRYRNYEEAYHSLILHLIKVQVESTKLVLDANKISRIFVDGGFSKNHIYMSLMAKEFPEVEVFGASMAQATALGAALAIHDHWNELAIPNDLIALRYFRNK